MSEIPLDDRSLALDQLARTRFWVQLLAVAGFAAAVAVSFMPLAALLSWKNLAWGEIAFVGLVPIVIYLPVILVPSLLLYRYASAIGEVTKRSDALVEAMKMQRLFFTTLVVMVALVAIAAIVAPLTLLLID